MIPGNCPIVKIIDTYIKQDVQDKGKIFVERGTDVAKHNDSECGHLQERLMCLWLVARGTAARTAGETRG